MAITFKSITKEFCRGWVGTRHKCPSGKLIYCNFIIKCVKGSMEWHVSRAAPWDPPILIHLIPGPHQGVVFF